MRWMVSLYMVVSIIMFILQGIGYFKKSIVETKDKTGAISQILGSLFYILLGLWGAIILFITLG